MSPDIERLMQELGPVLDRFIRATVEKAMQHERDLLDAKLATLTAKFETIHVKLAALDARSSKPDELAAWRDR